MLKGLPKNLYVWIENAGTADEFINTAQSIDDISTENGSMEVGIYKLKEVKNAVNQTELFNLPKEQ